MRKDGTHFSVSLPTNCIRNGSDKITGFIGITTELSQTNGAKRTIDFSLPEARYALEKGIQQAVSNGTSWDLEARFAFPSAIWKCRLSPCLMAGMDNYLSQPIPKELLAEALEKAYAEIKRVRSCQE